MQIAPHARQVFLWKPSEVYQAYQPVALGTAIDFSPDFPVEKIELRKVDLIISDLQVRVGLEFLRLLMALAGIPHLLQGVHHIVVAHPEDDDCR